MDQGKAARRVITWRLANRFYVLAKPQPSYLARDSELLAVGDIRSQIPAPLQLDCVFRKLRAMWVNGFRRSRDVIACSRWHSLAETLKEVRVAHGEGP